MVFVAIACVFIFFAIATYINEIFDVSYVGYSAVLLVLFVFYLCLSDTSKKDNEKKKTEKREIELREAKRKAEEEDRLRKEKNRERQRKYRAKKKAEKTAAQAEEKIAALDLSTVSCDSASEVKILLEKACLSTEDIVKIDNEDLIHIIARCEGDLRYHGSVSYNYMKDGITGILPHLYDSKFVDVNTHIEKNSLNSHSEGDSSTMAGILAEEVENGTCSLQDVLDYYNASDVNEMRQFISSEEENLFDFDKLEEMENDENEDFALTGYYKEVGATSDPNEVAPTDRDAFWDDQEMEDEMIMGYGLYGGDEFFEDDD